MIKRLIVGELDTNCWILSDPQTRKTGIIDPGGEADKILKTITKNNLEVLYILNTHGHPDHVAANKEIKDKTNAKILIHQKDLPLITYLENNLSSLGINFPFFTPDDFLSEEKMIKIGKYILKVLFTPGHTPGGVCLATSNFVFTGDTLFSGSVGRTDLPGGNWETLLTSIKEKLLTLGDQFIIYPGHGPYSTIGQEKKINPFLSP